MMKSFETDKFYFSGIKLNKASRKSIRSDRNVGELVITGLREATVVCLNCKHEWVAKSYGEEAFSEKCGGEVWFKCVGCDSKGKVDFRRFKENGI